MTLGYTETFLRDGGGNRAGNLTGGGPRGARIARQETSEPGPTSGEVPPLRPVEIPVTRTYTRAAGSSWGAAGRWARPAPGRTAFRGAEEGAHGAGRHQRHGADEWQRPTAGRVDDPAERDGREDRRPAPSRNSSTRWRSPTVAARCPWGRPHRADRQFGEEEGGAEREGGQRRILDEQDRIELRSDRTRPPTTRSRRARLRLPVARRIRSLTRPPRASPSTPPKKTTEAKTAECLRSSL